MSTIIIKSDSEKEAANVVFGVAGELADHGIKRDTMMEVIKMAYDGKSLGFKAGSIGTKKTAAAAKPAVDYVEESEDVGDFDKIDLQAIGGRPYNPSPVKLNPVTTPGSLKRKHPALPDVFTKGTPPSGKKNRTPASRSSRLSRSSP